MEKLIHPLTRGAVKDFHFIGKTFLSQICQTSKSSFSFLLLSLVSFVDEFLLAQSSIRKDFKL